MFGLSGKAREAKREAKRAKEMAELKAEQVRLAAEADADLAPLRTEINEVQQISEKLIVETAYCLGRYEDLAEYVVPEEENAQWPSSEARRRRLLIKLPDGKLGIGWADWRWDGDKQLVGVDGYIKLHELTGEDPRGGKHIANVQVRDGIVYYAVNYTHGSGLKSRVQRVMDTLDPATGEPRIEVGA